MTDPYDQSERGEAARIRRWLASADGRLGSEGASEVSEEWVPGAKSDERQQLAALGGLVRGVVGNGQDLRSMPEFAPPQMQRWISGGPNPPEEVITSAKTLLASPERDTVLADLYARAVSPSGRRHLGTFFTDPAVVDWMIERWGASQANPRTVVDVGAGVGIFTTRAADRWPDAQIFAVDINPVTLGLLALRARDDFRIRSARSSAPGVRLVLDDYVSWIQQEWQSLAGGRLIIGNPPYTRLQLLARADRARLIRATGGLCGSRASLAAIMTATTVRLLDPQDGLCLLLPAQWLETDYAVKLRDHIWSLRQRRVELHLFNSTPFTDVQVDAVALLIGQEEKSSQPLIVGSDGKDRTISRTGRTPDRWRALFDGPTVVAARPSEVKLEDFARVKRGIATGNNGFFILTESSRRAAGVPLSAVRPMVRRLRSLPDRLDLGMFNEAGPSDRYYLLTATARQVERLKGLSKYIAEGIEANVHDGVLCRSRACWFDLTSEIFIPDVIVGPMTKGYFRLVENEAKAVISNNLYGLTWRDETAPPIRTRILGWLRSASGQQVLKGAARAQGDNLLKIEPRAFNNLPVPPQFARFRNESLSVKA